MTEYPPKFIVPAHGAREAPPTIQLKLEFDEPIEVVGEKYTSNYYRCTVVAAPDFEAGTVVSLVAYAGLRRAIEQAGAGAGSIIDIIRSGEGTSTRYDVEVINKVYKKPQSNEEYIDDSTKKLSYVNKVDVSLPPQTMSNNRRMYIPKSPDQMDLALRILEQELHTYDQFIKMIKAQEFFGELSDDQAVRVATGFIIKADREHWWDMESIGEIGSAFVEKVKLLNSTGKSLASAVLSAILDETLYESINEIVEDFKSLGLSSANIIADEPESWEALLAVAKAFSSRMGNMGKNQAKAEIAEEYGLEYTPDDIAF